jgi:hypothetical protein
MRRHGPISSKWHPVVVASQLIRPLKSPMARWGYAGVQAAFRGLIDMRRRAHRK